MKTSLTMALLLALHSNLACAGDLPLLILPSTDDVTIDVSELPASGMKRMACTVLVHRIEVRREPESVRPGPVAVLGVSRNEKQLRWKPARDGYYTLEFWDCSEDELEKVPPSINDSRLLWTTIVVVGQERTEEDAGILRLISGRRFREAGAAVGQVEPLNSERGIAMHQLYRLILARIGPAEFLQRSRELRHEGSLQEARKELEKALIGKPGDVEAMAELGSLLVELGEFEAAAETLQRALEAERSDDVALNLSIARYRLKRWDDAWAACHLCLKWSDKGSRLQERAAEIGVAIAARLEERARRLEVYAEIVKWAGETEGGKGAAKELK